MGSVGVSVGVDVVDEADHLGSDVGIVAIDDEAGEVGEILVFKDAEAEELALGGGLFHGLGFPIGTDAGKDAEFGAPAVEVINLGLEAIEVIEGIDDGVAGVAASLGIELFELRARELRQIDRRTLLAIIGRPLGQGNEFVVGQLGDNVGLRFELLLDAGLEFGFAVEVCEHASNFLSGND